MESTQNTSETQQVQEKEDTSGGIFTTGKIILFFVIAVVIVLIVLGSLGIIRSDNLFRFLTSVRNIGQQSSISITPAETSVVPTKAIIFYETTDEDNAKKALKDFITTVVPSTALPPSPFTITVSHSGAMRVFSINWQNDQGSYLATLLQGYQENPLTIRRISLFIVPSSKKNVDQSISIDNTKKILTSFFPSIPSQTSTQCAKTVVQGTQISYCQAIGESSGQKKSYGIFSSGNTFALFACQIPKESPYFVENNPCIADN